MEKTEIVYIVSPDWGCYLFASLHSLVLSGSHFDKVRVFCIGKKPNSWTFTDSRIIVDEVDSLDNNYFLLNKTYITQCQAERVILLDADTLILSPIDQVWRTINADFIARIASQYRSSQWDHDKWNTLFSRINGSQVPYFNCGFCIFQNGAQAALADVWRELTQKGLRKELFDPAEIHGPRFTEQIALSLAIGSKGLSFHSMNKKEHAFAWKLEPYEDAVVYHTSSKLFYSCVTTINQAKSLHLGRSTVTNKFNSTQFQLVWNLLTQKLRRKYHLCLSYLKHVRQ